MKNYTVYFELYGKKMKTNVFSDNMVNAQQMVKDKIVFHKVELTPNDVFNKSTDIMDELIDILKTKKA